jgi:hypothetical protein
MNMLFQRGTLYIPELYKPELLFGIPSSTCRLDLRTQFQHITLDPKGNRTTWIPTCAGMTNNHERDFLREHPGPKRKPAIIGGEMTPAFLIDVPISPLSKA